ncbi:LOW QUALITY PROTEIN: intraflagellar transport-associated protein [Ara ararauna]
MMGKQLLNSSILDQFINSHEQSYEEFLNTLTYLFKEEERKTIHGNKVDSLRKIFSTSKLPNRNKWDGSRGRSMKRVFLLTQLPNENKTVMNKSWKAGGPDENNLRLSESVKVRFSLFFFKALQAFTQDFEIYTLNGRLKMIFFFYSTGSLLLPGEVEQTVTYCTSVFDKPIQLKSRTLSVPSHWSKTQELLGDDVHPFSLDEKFDYDNGAEAELKAIIDLSEEKKTGTDVKSA